MRDGKSRRKPLLAPPSTSTPLFASTGSQAVAWAVATVEAEQGTDSGRNRTRGYAVRSTEMRSSLWRSAHGLQAGLRPLAATGRYIGVVGRRWQDGGGG